ncbi:CBS domain-containing protein [Streptacidiphilus monticola]|uniref:CBS domain-containing protein n=1 Tax=Streptacidiphilus monticola TaxID=2161674 RepID=A0ABW1FTW6_9ACTN
MDSIGRPHLVSDVMTRAVVSVGQETGFRDVVVLMSQWKVSAVPVVAGDGRVVGVVSEADLLPKEEFRDADPPRIEQLRRLQDLAKAGAVTAGDLMTAPAVTVHADATLAEAARVMAVRRVKRLPVVDAEGVLVGVVSRGDLLKVFLRPDEAIAQEVRHEVLDRLFGRDAALLAVSVEEGVVTLSGRLADTAQVPIAARLVRAVEGVVDIRWALTGQTLLAD